jgi:hypothetical protein
MTSGFQETIDGLYEGHAPLGPANLLNLTASDVTTAAAGEILLQNVTKHSGLNREQKVQKNRKSPEKS